MEILIIYDSKKDLSKIKYVFNFIFNLPISKSNSGIKYLHISKYSKEKLQNKITINYTDNILNEVTLNIKKDNFDIFDINNASDINKLHLTIYSYKNKKLFGISSINSKSSFITNNIISLDIPQVFFFHLSRLEEYYSKKEQLDHHDRMKSSEQFLVKNNIYRFPVLDHIAFAFLEILGLEKKIATLKIMSHDIDVIQKFPNFYKFTRGVARILLKNKKHKGSLSSYFKWFVKVKLGKTDPYDTFSWLFTKQKMFKKKVYFMAGGLTNYDNLYDINNPKLQKYIELAKKNDYEIGLHPSYKAFTNEKQFIKEKKKLEYVCGCKIKSTRQHILHYDFNKTTDILENNNIKNDSTYGFQDLIGFKCGTGFDYPIWNFKTDKPRKIKETPLIIMDGCLLMEANYNVDIAKEIYNQFLKENKYNTQITFNFHNSIFDPVLLNHIKLKQLFFEL